MCAHYEAVSKPERLHDVFKVALPTGAVGDVWPGYAGIFIRHPREEVRGDGMAAPWREAMVGSFGLIPHWAKEPSVAKKTYNARSETVATSPAIGTRGAWGGAASSLQRRFTNRIGGEAERCLRALPEPMVSRWGLRASGQAGERRMTASYAA